MQVCYEHGCNDPALKGSDPPMCGAHIRRPGGLPTPRPCPRGCVGVCQAATVQEVRGAPGSKVELTRYVTLPEKGACAMFGGPVPKAQEQAA